jgi:ABC-type antimicrobial peptide transport system permease subunit
VLVSESLARELDSRPGDALLIRIEKPSRVPIESLYGNKDDLGRTLRLTIRQTLSATQLGEFATRPQQSGVRAVFVPLRLLQRELDQPSRVNTVLVSNSKDAARLSEEEKTKALVGLLKDTAALEDYNVKLRLLDQARGISLERSSTLLDDKLAEIGQAAAQRLPAQTVPVLSYVANNISSDRGSIPYSLVSAVDDVTFEELRGRDTAEKGRVEAPAIILNEWAARDLDARAGDSVSLEYYVWHEDGRLETKNTQFRLAAIVPIKRLAADQDLVPEYPGISESNSLSDWNPPFPIFLNRIRTRDEDYWKQYRTTPKAFIPLSAGQKLWQSRFGKLTSLRIKPASSIADDQALKTLTSNLKADLDPPQMGFQVLPARAQGLEASRGATDFGEYFLYFSFFLVISALLLAALFFKLGIEQRLREIGTLQAIGFSAAKIRRLFLIEAFILAIAGSLLGLIGAVAYGYLILVGLRTWWVDAVGTTLLTLHVSALSLGLGAAGGVFAVVISIAWTLRRLGRASTRSLLSGAQAWEVTRRRGDTETRRDVRALIDSRPPRRRVSASPRLLIATAFAFIAISLLLAAYFRLIPDVAGFFGGGAALLVALLCYQSVWLRRSKMKAIQGTGWLTVSRLGFRNTIYRPGRSVLCIALIGLSTFIIVAVDAFRRNDTRLSQDQKSGSGGFPLMAESLLPLVQDPNTAEGRQALNLGNDEGASIIDKTVFARFRLRPGDDASCLNLYAPRAPRILAATDSFIRSSRFAFQSSLSHTKEETENPWLLLNRELEAGIVPVISDANSISYVLHLKVGDEFVLNRNEGAVRLRIVGALADSIFQSELLMSEKNFLRLFPDQQGYRVFLIDAPERDAPVIAATLEKNLDDFGFDVVSTNERLANFHRVENTYLSTFQMLGSLGLVLGTLGMAAVLLRNVFERRKELALLRAVGYASSHFALMVIAENALLLLLGLFTGAVCALIAILPVFFERGGRLPNISLGFLLVAVLISGLTASMVATWAALRSPLLPALRAE